jgi:hypothetical protein
VSGVPGKTGQSPLKALSAGPALASESSDDSQFATLWTTKPALVEPADTLYRHSLP